jgi:Calcineurin-like phosphoesterase
MRVEAASNAPRCRQLAIQLDATLKRCMYVLLVLLFRMLLPGRRACAVRAWMPKSRSPTEWFLLRFQNGITRTNHDRDFSRYRFSNFRQQHSSFALLVESRCFARTDHDRLRRPLTALFSSWQVGDTVIVVPNDVSQLATTGTVAEVRGRGWYAVQVGTDLVKCRGTQLRAVDGTTTTNNTPGASAVATVAETGTAAAMNYATPTITTSNDAANDLRPINAPPSPTMHDLDAILRQRDDPAILESEYLEQVAYFRTVKQWVVFTDLHCSSSTLDTCLQILDQIHAEAVQRQAGIAFLGDWWHVRGTLRVDCLNAVLDRIQHWQQPMVLIPGNHDQVTAAITDNHSLMPLQHAYRVPVLTDANAAINVNPGVVVKTIPGLLIFSHPTVFNNALWIPHIRSPAVLESVLQSDAAAKAVAVFCHADVTGASMNDNIVSQGGVPPRIFPPNKPIYAGHFHKPHTVSTVTNGKDGEKEVRCIEYLGSPYEVSLSEAQQPKALAVLDSSQGWMCIERIPLDVGRKHFRPATFWHYASLQHRYLPAKPRRARPQLSAQVIEWFSLWTNMNSTACGGDLQMCRSTSPLRAMAMQSNRFRRMRWTSTLLSFARWE